MSLVTLLVNLLVSETFKHNPYRFLSQWLVLIILSNGYSLVSLGSYSFYDNSWMISWVTVLWIHEVSPFTFNDKKFLLVIPTTFFNRLWYLTTNGTPLAPLTVLICFSEKITKSHFLFLIKFSQMLLQSYLISNVLSHGKDCFLLNIALWSK